MKTKINKTKIFYLSFAGFGLLFLLVGIVAFTVSHLSFVRFKETGIKTDGIISGIRSSGDNKDVFITYKTNDGKDITTEINYYNSNMYAGKNVELYYDPINPNKIVLISSNTSLLFLLPFCVLGSVFFIIGIVFIKKIIVFEKQRDKLILSGKCVIADIIEVNKNKNIKLIGISPYIILSHYSEDGRDYFFKSHNIWFKPANFLSKKVRIYLDRNDYTKYYVDEDSLDKR